MQGRVFDSETGKPIEGVTVIVVWPAAADGAEPRQEVQVTDAEGAFAFPPIPAGTYRINFVKSGYRSSNIASFDVQAGQRNRADFPLPALPPETSSEVLDLEEFVVEASTVDEMMASLELRMDSDQLVNVMSAEDLSKFAATDVGDALKRVAGVNIVEGQFAIIRGLEDRYSSTMYNSAVIPSPDPNRQSVQLDLFPSEVVSNLIVSKTFAPELPSNSSGGSIDIVTHGYPSEFTVSLAGAGRFNENAVFDRFIEFEKGSPVGSEWEGAGPFGAEGGGFVGGRFEFADREFRFKALGNWDLEYVTAEGWQESRQPRRPEFTGIEGRPNMRIVSSGGLALGELLLTGGRYDLTTSERSAQTTGYGGFGFDIDREGNHRIDASIFYTSKKQEIVEAKENGYLPGFDYSVPIARQQQGGGQDWDTIFQQTIRGCLVCSTKGAWITSTARENLDGGATRGPAWFTNFSESRSFDVTRDLLVYQVNGEHSFPMVRGLDLRWAVNHAKTKQQETALGAGIFYEPANVADPDYQIPTQFPVSVATLGPGVYATTSGSGIIESENDIQEKQYFGRLDGKYEVPVTEALSLTLTTGGWYEHARRDVASKFLENPTVGGISQFAITGETPLALGRTLFNALDSEADGDTSFTRDTSNESKREIWAWNLGSKATVLDQVDVLGGFRLEKLLLESTNDAFTGVFRFCNPASPVTFPETFILFDRIDNPGRCENSVPAGTIFNDEVLGINVPVDPVTGYVDLTDRSEIEQLMNGEIDELKILPTAGLTYRPLPGLAWRNAWSQTVARPSFREMGFYASVELGSDDLVTGNPQLQLSEVTSWDTRVEYAFGEYGDLAALSGFYKTIEKPIESILVRNPVDVRPGVVWRTWFNNPNTAKLWGIEVEARKHLDFIGVDFGKFVSLGGNFTYIHARVDRTEAELSRAQFFFATAPGETASYSGLESSRRLFNQPKWIANADISFEQPDWGTRATLAFFAISDVLDAAGTSIPGPDQRIQGVILDRYLDSYYQLDLILSQTWAPDFLRGGSVTVKASLKNLTDSTRRIIYDTAQTSDEISEREYKLGRNYKFSIVYEF